MEEIEKHCKSFYIRANRCSSLYNDIFALRGWKTEEINGIEFELSSILVEKWKGKAYRLVIQRQKRMDGGENGAFPPTRNGCIHSLSMRERG